MSAYDITQCRKPGEMAGADNDSDSDLEVLAVIIKTVHKQVAAECVPSKTIEEEERKRDEEVEELRRKTINVALEDKENRISFPTIIKTPLKMAPATTSPRIPSQDNKSLRQRAERTGATPTPSPRKTPARDKPSTSTNQSSILKFLVKTPNRGEGPSTSRAAVTTPPTNNLTAIVPPRNRTLSSGSSPVENATLFGPSRIPKRVRPLTESSPECGPSTSSAIPAKRRSENINRTLRVRLDSSTASTSSAAAAPTTSNSRRAKSIAVTRRSERPPSMATQQSASTNPRRKSLNLKRKATETAESQQPKVIRPAVANVPEPVVAATSTLSNDPDELGLKAYYSDEETEDTITAEDVSRRPEKLLRVPVAVVTHPLLGETKHPPVPRGEKMQFRGRKTTAMTKTVQKSKKPVSYRVNRRVKVLRVFVPKIPRSCHEALRANEHGSSERKKEFIGLPKKKFDTRDNKEFGQKDDWDVQAVYQCDEDPDYSLVLYEGWTCTSMARSKTTEFAATAPEMIKLAEMRDIFLAAFKLRAEQKAREYMVKKKAENGEDIPFETALERFCREPAHAKRDPTKWLWVHEDVTYFHTVHHKEHILGPIWYMDLINPSPEKPPEYGYTAVNILTFEAYLHCKNSLASLPFEKLAEKVLGKRNFFVPPKEGTCENLKECKCTARFELLYGRHNKDNVYTKTREMFLQKDGTIDLTGFVFDLSRVIMECSDECGCSWQCPRRRLQQGQKKPVVVCREHGKGYGLRAAQSFKKGELVCEYTGNMFMCAPEEVYKPQVVAFRTEQIIKERNERQQRKKDREAAAKEAAEPKKVEKKETNGKKEVVHDASYEAALNVTGREMVICAKKNGNIARFANHHCDPNTAFFEVDSRRYIEDPLIPRVAIYAIKDIEIAEEITVAYWDPELKYTKLSNLKCDCGAKKCIKFLPGEHTVDIDS